MAIVKHSPTSPGTRFAIKVVNKDLHKGEPHAALLVKKSKTGGRNNQGRITCRHIGGGHKQKYRLVDFKRDKDGITAKVERLEYDPNRSARLALLHYADGVKSYILAPVGLSVGDQILASPAADIKAGNCLPLKNIPIGTEIHNIELRPGKGAQMVRAAGGVAQLMAREGLYANVRLPSGESRQVHIDCMATIGQVGNVEHELVRLGKAGRARWLGHRPHNRGVSMNPVDHPHGGGEGKTSGGRHPVSPWGQPTKGYRTRNNKRTNNMIIKRRK